MISDEEAQEMIKDEVGPIRVPGLDQRIARYWNYHTERAGGNQELHILYTKISVLKYAQGRARSKVDRSVGTERFMWGQQFRNLQLMLDREEARLKVLDPSFNVSAAGVLDTTSNLPDSIGDAVAREENYGLYGGKGSW